MRINGLILSMTILLALLVSLTGCIIIPIYYRYDDIDTDNVSSVDVYDLRNSENRYRDLHETESPVYTLTEDQLDEFWSDLAEIQFSDAIVIVPAAIDPSFSYGVWVIRINYIDGSYTFISSGGLGQTLDESGEIIDFNYFSCDNEEWEQFISKYLPEELFESPSQAD